MASAHDTPITELPGGRVLRIDDGAGQGIAVFDGMVWVTQTGDERDVFLRRGETFRFDRGGIALVEALRDARFVLWDGTSGNGGLAAAAVAAAVAVGSSAFLTLQARQAATSELLACADVVVR